MFKLSRKRALVLVVALLATPIALYLTRLPTKSESSVLEQERLGVKMPLRDQHALASPAPAPIHAKEATAAASDSNLTAMPIVRKDLLSQNLGRLYEEALGAKNPEDRTLALYVGGECVGITTRHQLSLKEMIRLKGDHQLSTQPEVQTYENLIKIAKHDLEKFCGTGNHEDFFARLKGIRSTGNQAVGRLWVGLNRSSAADSPGRQEYVQALMLVLSSPSQYPAHFEWWTRSVAFRKLASSFPGAPHSSQVDLIADVVMERFGVGHMIPWRQRMRCAFEAKCLRTEVLSDGNRKQVEMVADQIEQLIRTQRWDVLIVPRD